MWCGPKVMRMIFSRILGGPRKKSGNQGNWRGTLGIQSNLP